MGRPRLYASGDVVFTSRVGATVRYSPYQGSSRRYNTTCKHGKVVGDRTQADARWSARHPEDFCEECKGWLMDADMQDRRHRQGLEN